MPEGGVGHSQVKIEGGRLDLERMRGLPSRERERDKEGAGVIREIRLRGRG